MITSAAHEVVEAGALTAEDDDEIAREIELVVVTLPMFVESDDPEILLFEILKGADEVDDAGDAKMLGRSGTGFDGHRTEGRGSALRDNDAVNTGTIGNAEERAKILRIFDTIDGENETSGGRVSREGHVEVFDGQEFLGTDERYYSLVGWSLGSERQLVA
jgi:hypothetical protein